MTGENKMDIEMIKKAHEKVKTIRAGLLKDAFPVKKRRGKRGPYKKKEKTSETAKMKGKRMLPWGKIDEIAPPVPAMPPTTGCYDTKPVLRPSITINLTKEQIAQILGDSRNISDQTSIVTATVTEVKIHF